MDIQIDKDIYQKFVLIYVSACTFLGVGYLVAITFIPIPEQNIRHADTISGFMMGTFITSCLAFVVGGSLVNNKKKSTPQPPGTTEVDLTVKTTPEAPRESSKDENEIG